jgi:cyclopropane fatty-acyl-phospholipid synthase-like methyltransferase
VFVDLEKVAEEMGSLADQARVLDVGGGDGALLNLLLERSPNATVTLVDASPGVGGQISPCYRDRVNILGGTTLADYAASNPEPPDVVLVSDVMHHVPPSERLGFFTDLKRVLRGSPFVLIFKDMEPGHFRTTLGGWADRYISGDRKVEFISGKATTALVKQVFSGVQCRETALFVRDRPNYCLIFSIPGQRSDRCGSEGPGND